MNIIRSKYREKERERERENERKAERKFSVKCLGTYIFKPLRNRERTEFIPSIELLYRNFELCNES